MSGFSKGANSIVIASYQFGSQTGNVSALSVPYWNGSNTNAAGLYRFSYQLEVDTAASVSSTLPALQIVAYNRQGVQNTITSATNTGNTTATYTSGVFVLDVRTGSANDVTYATTGYASSAAGMVYSFRFVVEYLGNV